MAGAHALWLRLIETIPHPVSLLYDDLLAPRLWSSGNWSCFMLYIFVTSTGL